MDTGSASHRRVALASLMVVSGLFVAAGWLGRDFGYHWDEAQFTSAVASGLRSGVLLPSQFNYPSVAYWLTLFCALPEWIRNGAEAAAVFVGTPAFLLRARAVFVLLALLGLGWVFDLARRLSGSWVCAALAAGLLGGSWEYAYHARWLATDVLMAQFAILSMLLLTRYLQTGASGALAAAAIAAGLCCGSKYPGGLVALVSAAWILRAERNWRPAARYAVISAVTYLLSTPATYIMPVRFFADVAKQRALYLNGFAGYTVHRDFHHFSLLSTYLASQALSPYYPIALLLSALAVWGAVHGLRRHRRVAVPLIAFPVLYALHFSNQKVLIVRNYQALIPFLALWSAVGAWDFLSRSRGRWLAPGLLGAMLLNHAWQLRSAATVHPGIQDAELASEIRSYLARDPKRRYVGTRTVRDLLMRYGGEPANLVRDAQGARELLFISPIDFWEKGWCLSLRANRPGVYHLPREGPFDVNFDYYPTWQGARRLVAVALDDAQSMGLRWDVPAVGLAR